MAGLVVVVRAEGEESGVKGRVRPGLRDRAGDTLTLKLWESTTNVRTPMVHWE